MMSDRFKMETEASQRGLDVQKSVVYTGIKQAIDSECLWFNHVNVRPS